jgi:hypothetical protein
MPADEMIRKTHNGLRNPHPSSMQSREPLLADRRRCARNNKGLVWQLHAPYLYCMVIFFLDMNLDFLDHPTL